MLMSVYKSGQFDIEVVQSTLIVKLGNLTLGFNMREAEELANAIRNELQYIRYREFQEPSAALCDP